MGSQVLTIQLDDEQFEAVLGDNLLSSLLSQGAAVREKSNPLYRQRSRSTVGYSRSHAAV